MLRHSFLFCSFLFHSRRRRGPSLALISARLGHRLPAAVAAARSAPLPPAASLTFCYFLASLLLPPRRPPCSLPSSSRGLPALPARPGRLPPPASPPPARCRLRGCPASWGRRAPAAGAPPSPPGHAPRRRARPEARERAGAEDLGRLEKHTQSSLWPPISKVYSDCPSISHVHVSEGEPRADPHRQPAGTTKKLQFSLYQDYHSLRAPQLSWANSPVSCLVTPVPFSQDYSKFTVEEGEKILLPEKETYLAPSSSL